MEWVKMSERKPDEIGNYLLFLVHEEGFGFGIDYYDGTCNDFPDMCTYWMKIECP